MFQNLLRLHAVAYHDIEHKNFCTITLLTCVKNYCALNRKYTCNSDRTDPHNPRISICHNNMLSTVRLYRSLQGLFLLDATSTCITNDKKIYSIIINDLCDKHLCITVCAYQKGLTDHSVSVEALKTKKGPTRLSLLYHIVR